VASFRRDLARAPYLHHGAVPALRDLLEPVGKPAQKPYSAAMTSITQSKSVW
jgi:hypothetical protein